MKIYLDNFSDFVPGPSARDLWDEIDRKGKMEAFEMILDDMYPDGLSDTGLNDLLRFDDDWIRSALEMPEDEEPDFSDDDEQPADDEESFGCCCDCTECDYTEECSENGRYDFSDDDELQNDLLAEQNEQQ